MLPSTINRIKYELSIEMQEILLKGKETTLIEWDKVEVITRDDQLASRGHRCSFWYLEGLNLLVK